MASLLRGFATVNQAADGQPDSEPLGLTTEAKEQRAIAAFERALALIQSRREAEAEAALRTLLEEPVVADGATDQLHRIKFLAFKNLGDLLARRPGEALAFYSLATEMVEDDALLWNKLGTLAAEAGYMAAARTAFERGLEVDPQHPTMPDKLLGLLSQAGDAPAAATLASALLRQNPRHTGAAAVLAAQQRGSGAAYAAAAGAGLLQLPPVGERPGREALRSQRKHLERPRTLEQPTWQQLLHHSLLFLTGNKLVEGAAPAAPGGGPLPERKMVPSLVRFNYKKNPPPGQQPPPSQQPQQQAGQEQDNGPETSPAATAAQESPQPAGAPATAEHGQQEQQQQHRQDLATPASSVSPSPTPAAAQGEDASPAAMAIDQSPPAPAGLEAATPAAPAELSPAALPAGTGVASLPSSALAHCPPAASTAASPAEQEQEERHPNGRASRKLEGCSTRSRAATGIAPLPLVPVAAGGDQEQTPDEEALELLGMLGLRLNRLQQAAPEAGAPSPLLSSPAKAGPGAGGASSNDQQGAAAQQQEEAAVKAFIKGLPAHGVSRPDLVDVLLSTLGSSGGAAQLSPAARLQLLQVAHYVEHDGLPHTPEQCLVLGELFADAAVAAARASPQPGTAPPAAAVASSSNAAAQASHGSTPTAPGLRQPSGLVKRLASARGRRTELSLEQLQHSCQLWLSRYRLEIAEAAEPPSDEQLRAQARYWWATGRLLESSADMLAASTAYARCEGTLNQLVGLAISLPHCQADASISQATVKAKQEALQLHTVLGAAGQSAAAGNQSAVVDALAPVLLCCTDKEQQMLQLDEQQWLRGMHMLLSAATASGSLGLVLRSHLRLLNALLPAVPPQLLPLVQGREDAADSQAAAALHTAAEQLMARREAAGALDAAASFLQQHCTALSLPAATECSNGSAEQQQRQEHQVALPPMELAMYEEVQQQAVLAVASCAASLAAGPAAAESALNLKVNAKRGAMVDAATILLLLDSLAAGRQLEEPAAGGGNAGSIKVLQAVERAQDVAWHLCEALGTAQALMDRRGRFVQACMGKLQLMLKQLDVPGTMAAIAQTGDVPDAAELRQQLTGGVQHCLFWLFGLELPGFDKQEEWGGDFHVKGGTEAAARQLTSPQAVANVWPLVEPFLLEDIEHVAKHKGFLQAAAEHFSELPAAVAARSAAAWRQLAAAEPPHMPCSSLDGACPDAMQRLLELASQAPALQPIQGQEGIAAPSAVDAQDLAPARPEGANEAQLTAVRRSLFYLLSELQDKERTSMDNLLGDNAEAAVERHVQAAKADLCFNPQRSATWEKLAHDYHGAADDLLDAASKTITHREWRHGRDLRHRVRLWRRLAYWATAGAWLTATSDDDRTRLLAASGWRLLQDVLRTLPCQDPLGSNAAWQQVKASDAYQEGCHLAEAAFDAAAAALEEQDDMAGWDLLVAKARCLRKQQQQPANWLPLLARACHYASDEGGMLYPLYALHASRMRLLLATPSAARWASSGAGSEGPPQRSIGRRTREQEQQNGEQERELLQLVGRYCFLPTSNTSLNSQSQQARRPAAAAAKGELREDWQGLLEDCCAAMRWCLEKDRSFHRAAYRLAVAMQYTGQPLKAVALLEPLFTRGKQIFTANMTPILETKVDAPTRRGRKARQLGDGRQQQQQEQEQLEQEGKHADSMAEPECNWGEAPPRLAGIGMQEDEATFGTRLRKTLRLYLSCLADAAVAAVDGQAPPDCEAGRQPPLEVLQQAAAYISSIPQSAGKAWDGCDKLARGYFLLALVACLQACCPLEQLPGLGPPAPTPGLALTVGAGTGSGMEVDASEVQHSQQQPAGQQTPGAALIAAHAAHAVGPLSIAPASAVHATPAEAAGTVRSLWPTPATQARHQVSEQLLQVAARLDGTPAEALLAKAHQVFNDYSLHAEGDDKWHSMAGPAVQEVLSNSSSSLAADEKLRQRCSQPNLRKMFNLYAMLHVHLLQHQGAADKLLTLLLTMKKRVKGLGSADARQARFLRRQALTLSEALLGAVESALAKAEQDVAAGSLSSVQPAAEDLAAVMEVDGQPAGAPTGQAQQEQQPHMQAQQAAPPALAGGAAELQSPPAPAGPARPTHNQQTPGEATANTAVHGSTPGTDLRAVLGSPAALPSAEQQLLQERCMALLQVAHSFQRDLSRWLQIVGAAAGSSNAVAREEMRALGSIGEDVLLRAYRLHARCTGQPTMAELSRQSRAEQLKAADEAARQQRRQSRQQGAAARQQQQQGGAATVAAGALPPIAEGGDEQPTAPGGRKRGAPAPSEAAPPTTRKRLRSQPSVAPQPQPTPQDEQEEEAAAAVVHEVVSQALEAVAADARHAAQ